MRRPRIALAPAPEAERLSKGSMMPRSVPPVVQPSWCHPAQPTGDVAFRTLAPMRASQINSLANRPSCSANSSTIPI